MHSFKLLKEIRDKAVKNYLEDPLDEEKRKLMYESNGLYLVLERDEDEDGEDEDGEDYQGQYEEEPESDGDEGGFDIFDDDDESVSPDSRNPLRWVRMSFRNPVDPDFGLKAGLCFDSVNEYEKDVLKAIDKLKFGDEGSLLAVAGIYSPLVKNNLNQAKKKYRDALNDREMARMNPSMGTGSTIPPREEFSYTDFVADEMGNIAAADKSQYQKKFLTKSRGNLGNYVARDQIGATVSNIGAGTLEFLARMIYMTGGGQNPGVSTAIKVGSGEDLTRGKIKKQEEELFELAPSTVGYNSLRTFRDYLSHAVREALEPIVKKIHMEEFISRGMDQVIDGILAGQYKFEKANVGTWAFNVIKNKSKDLLKDITIYKYDDSTGANWANTFSFPLTIHSKANPTTAESLKAVGLLNYEEVDPDKKKKVKNEKGIFYPYVYSNMYDFLEDLRAANGFYKDAEGGEKKGTGRKKKYLEDSPLYYTNLSLMQRKNFMTSFSRSTDIDVEDFPELSTAQVPELDKNEREYLAVLTTKKISQSLNEIVDDIFNKIVTSSSKENKYSQKNIISFIKYNPELTKKIFKGLLNYGVYKFQRDRYKFVTAPETYLNQFFEDLYQSEYPGKELPTTVSNGERQIPVFLKGARSGESFLQDVRRVLLGTGKAGEKDPEALPLALKGKGESDDEFRRRVLASKSGEMKQSGGFLIQHPEYIRKIYAVLANMSVKAIAGREGAKGIDESMKQIKSMISEMRKNLDSYKNQVTRNFIKSFK